MLAIAQIRVEVHLAVPVSSEQRPVEQLRTNLLPRAHRPHLAQIELALHRERHGIDHAETAESDARGVEGDVVLKEGPAGSLRSERGGIGDPVRRLDPEQPTARGDDVERACVVGDRAEAESGAMRGGGHHARERLAVKAAHVRQRQAKRVEVSVQLADADPGLHAHEPLTFQGARTQQMLFQLKRLCEPARSQHKAAGQGDV